MAVRCAFSPRPWPHLRLSLRPWPHLRCAFALLGSGGSAPATAHAAGRRVAPDVSASPRQSRRASPEVQGKGSCPLKFEQKKEMEHISKSMIGGKGRWESSVLLKLGVISQNFGILNCAGGNRDMLQIGAWRYAADLEA